MSNHVLYNDEYSSITIVSLKFFDKVIIKFLKSTSTEGEWSNFCNFFENTFETLIKRPFIIIIKCTETSLLSIKKLKELKTILLIKEDFIDKYWIESHFIIGSILTKSITNLFLTLYKPRKPYQIFYSLEESNDYIIKIINKLN